MNSPRLRRIAWTLTALYASFHFVMTHLPPGQLPPIRTSDKALHFLSYGFLSGCFYLALWLGGMASRRAGLMVVFCAALFALFDEILQAPIGRDPELMDWVADVSAAVIAAVCLSLFRTMLPARPDDGPLGPTVGDEGSPG